MKQHFFKHPLGKLTLFIVFLFLLVAAFIYYLLLPSPTPNTAVTSSISFKTPPNLTGTDISASWDVVPNVIRYELYRQIGDGERELVYQGETNSFIEKREFPDRRYTYWVDVVTPGNIKQTFGPFFVLPKSGTVEPVVVDAPKVTKKIKDQEVIFTLRHSGENVDEFLVLVQAPGENDFAPDTVLAASAKKIRRENLPAGKYTYGFISKFQGALSDTAKITFSIAEKPPILPPTDNIVVIPKVEKREETPPPPPKEEDKPVALTLQPPTALKIDFQDDSYVHFSWDYIDSKKEKVLVQRKEILNGEFQTLQVLSASESFYMDENLTTGTTYYYQLITVYQDQQSAPSEMLNYTAGPTGGTENNGAEYEAGLQAFLRKDYALAKKHLQNIRKPENPVAQEREYLSAILLLGQIAIYENTLQSARSYLQEALEIDPKRAETYYWLGQYHLRTAAYKNAIENFDKVFKYQRNLSADSFESTLFYSHSGTIEALFGWWQSEDDPEQKGYLARGELDYKTTNFLNKYCNGNIPAGVSEGERHCRNVRIIQQTISNYSNLEVPK